MMYALLIALNVYLGIKCIAYKVQYMGFIVYLLRKGYTEPTKEELDQCNQYVIKNMMNNIHSLVRRNNV